MGKVGRSEKIRGRIGINYSIEPAAVFLPNIFEFSASGYQIFDCLPSIAKILVDTAQLIGMSLLSFAKLFTSRRLDSSHGSIYRHGIDVSISG